MPPQSREDLRSELHQAVHEGLGAGRSIQEPHLDVLTEKLLPTWSTLPRNENDLVDLRSLRYVVHRYMLQTYGLAITGLEPQQVNRTRETQEEVSLLMLYAPTYLRSSLLGASNNGFTLKDAVVLVATLEQLVHFSVHNIVEESYTSLKKDSAQELTKQEMQEVMERYLLRWMLGEDHETLKTLESDRSILEAGIENWNTLAAYAHGRVDHFEYQRRKAVMPTSKNWLKSSFSFDDAQDIAGGLTTSFGPYWETECARVKDSLVVMDRSKTGRVKLADFHGSALGGEWRFAESKEYLRQLGALDESSGWHGPRVIIPNYIQGASNCIIYSGHYRVCCQNECEGYMSQLEAAIASPYAAPEEILSLVSNMTATLADDEPRITDELRRQLQQIAAANNGKVPLHGRLFAQWLHYVFPYDCPFPHKAGSVSAQMPTEFLESLATEAEMKLSVSQGRKKAVAVEEAEEKVEDNYLSLWSREEELLAEHVGYLPWESRVATPLAGVILLVSGLLVHLLRSQSKIQSFELPVAGKAHVF